MHVLRRLVWVAPALALALALPRPAAAQYFGQNKVQYRTYDWRSITSDHFEVYYYTGLDSLAKRVLDLAEKTNAMLSARMGHQLGHRVPIILYGSHNDFSQTNVTTDLIDAGTGGFTEVLHNRVVLPFMGSYEDLRHVVVHELTHAFMFDLLYGGAGASLLARQSFFSVPLWFAEGLAEYYSLGMESNAEVFLRDGTVAGYLPPLQYAGGYIVYKQGQSALGYLVERHGEDRLRDLFQRIRTMRSFDRAFQRSMGVSVERFDEQWRTWLRKTYWPMVAVKEPPEEFARRLTDHRHDASSLNTSPAISPQGDRIAYYSDRHQYTDVYIMSAVDGRVISRLIRGERNVHFEAIPSFRSALTWSPDGTRIAMTVKSAGRDLVYVVLAKDGRILKEYDLKTDALQFPSWSPVSDSLVVVGVKDGRSDLYLVDTRNGDTRRLTDDTWDEKEPTWSPDGRRITFSSDRGAPVVLHPKRQERGFGAYGLYDLEVATGEVRTVLDTHGDDTSPAWSPDGKKLAFITDRSGAPNIALFDTADSTITQLTDVIGGVRSISWSRQNDRLVFSALDRGGFDIFAVKEPLGLDAVIARLQRQAPHTVYSIEAGVHEAPPDTVPHMPVMGALASAWPDSLTPRDSLHVGPPHEGEFGRQEGSRLDTPRVAAAPPLEPPPWTGGRTGDNFPVRPDTIPALPSRTPLVDNGGAFALSDSVLSQAPTPYRVRLVPDFAGGGFYANSSFGFIGSTQFLFSDFLGNHSIYVATDIFSSSLEETNALVVYQYLPRRWDLGGGMFHFKNYYSSRVTTLGDALGAPRLFSERNFGLIGQASYPFDRFHRMELSLTQLFAEIQFYDPLFGTPQARQYQSVTSPSVALVGDNALFGYYGPVNGRRYNFAFSPSFPVFMNGLRYNTFTADIRRYWDLTHGYTFAVRGLAGYSTGPNARTFLVGGFSTLRGFEDFTLEGSRLAIANVELRFPFIQQLGLVGPIPLGVFNLRGAAFADFGGVWNPGDQLHWSVINGHRRDYPYPGAPGAPWRGAGFGFGGGVRSAMSFLILKVDVAWNTNFNRTSKPRWYFSIGPEF